jgi:hypothetical protein
MLVALLASPLKAAQPALEKVRVDTPGKLVDFGPLQRVVKELNPSK